MEMEMKEEKILSLENSQEEVKEVDSKLEEEIDEINNTMEEEEKENLEGLYVGLRGLPWNIYKVDIVEFFKTIEDIQNEDVAFRFQRDGKFSGIAFVRLASEDQFKEAMSYHHKHIGNRYVQIFKSSQEEFLYALKSKKGRDYKPKQVNIDEIVSRDNSIIKGRGLPYNVTTQEIKKFFGKFKLFSYGIYRGYYRNRPDSQFYAVFESKKDVKEILKQLDRKNIGSRYIELFECRMTDFKDFLFKNKNNLINDIQIGFSKDFQLSEQRSSQRRSRNNYTDYNYKRDSDFRQSKNYREDRYRRTNRDNKFSRDRRSNDKYDSNKRTGYSPSKNPRTLLAKGFPYDVNLDDIRDFFSPYDKHIEYIYFINGNNGRFTGNCYIVFIDRKTSLNALNKRNYMYIGKRYIEMFKDAGEIDIYQK